MLIEIAVATALAVHTHPLYIRKKHHHPPPAVLSAAGPSVMQERALRRRVVRLARIKMYERRETMLFEFLAKARTETPLLEDASVSSVGGGIVIGPTSVTVDFLGSPIVRSTVRNTGALPVSPLLVVTLRDAAGTLTRASIAIERLDAGASRKIELLSPARASPVSLHWQLQR
ncbi:MAG: hypothetical protein JO219_05745 [Candidatus Eremiobacteraeota bacterium]|nr:hypothetical protein [Candidatus Eremiobacteraeota bacterium]